MHNTIVCITHGSRVPESRFPKRTPSQTRPNLPGDPSPKPTSGVLCPCSVALPGWGLRGVPSPLLPLGGTRSASPFFSRRPLVSALLGSSIPELCPLNSQLSTGTPPIPPRKDCLSTRQPFTPSPPIFASRPFFAVPPPLSWGLEVPFGHWWRLGPGILHSQLPTRYWKTPRPAREKITFLHASRLLFNP